MLIIKLQALVTGDPKPVDKKAEYNIELAAPGSNGRGNNPESVTLKVVKLNILMEMGMMQMQLLQLNQHHLVLRRDFLMMEIN